jgi:hypothetical protein
VIRKIILFVYLLFGIGVISNAQQNLTNYNVQPYNFGFLFGFTSSSFSLDYESGYRNGNDSIISATGLAKPGLNLGIITNLRITKNIDLRFIPTLAFSDRSIAFVYKDPVYNIKINVESTYAEFPVSLKFKTDRLRNVRAFVVVGGKYGNDILFNKTSNLEKEDKDKVPIRVKKDNFAIEFAFGVDLYYPYFKFSPEIRISKGLNNILLKNRITTFNSPLEALFAEALVLNLYFE